MSGLCLAFTDWIWQPLEPLCMLGGHQELVLWTINCDERSADTVNSVSNAVMRTSHNRFRPGGYLVQEHGRLLDNYFQNFSFRCGGKSFLTSC